VWKFYALSEHEYTKDEWTKLLTEIKEDFKRCGKGLSTIQRSLEHWTLFINPYRRLRYIVDGHVASLKQLELDKLQPVGAIQNGYDRKEFTKKLNIYISAHTKAGSLSSVIRMSAPVLVESFVNMVIFLTVKPEVKSDTRIYNDFIQEHIDIRLKTLPLFCDGFIIKPDESISQVKEFRPLNGSPQFRSTWEF
jgi:hypothetical protein